MVVSHEDPSATAAPPVFLRVAAHPVRWRLLSELARSDRRVHELTGLVAQPQNLVSYHLGQLRKSGLVSGRRSAADGRDMYYRLDLAGCGRLLAAVGGALHPALELRTPMESVAPQEPVSVLFLCTGNSARSQMAEALLREVTAGGRNRDAMLVRSAGSHPKPLHPHAVAVMAQRGVDLAGARSKHLDEFAQDHFDYVITLCDRVREICPELPGHPETSHWSIPDPTREPDGYGAFERTADELSERIGFLRHALRLRSAANRNGGQ